MKFISYARFLLLGVVSLVCVSGQAMAEGASVSASPKIEHWQTTSGTRVFFVENHALPMLDIQIDFPAGSAYDPPAKSGVAALTHALLDMGIEGMDETQISNRFADVGAQLSGGLEKDRASVSLRTLIAPEKRDVALSMLQKILAAPSYPQKVFAREKARTLAGHKESLTRPEVLASRAFWAAMYPEHPYGRGRTPESLANIERADLVNFYATYYQAKGASIAMIGDISREEATAIAERLSGALPKGSEKRIPSTIPAPTPLSAPKEERIEHPAAQAHIMIGQPALKRGDPDFFPLVVGNYTLGGGGFVSRLMTEVREKRGFAYSVSSYFSPLTVEGPFQMGLQTKKAQADEAVRVAREVLSRFLAEGPTEDELIAAKQNLAGSFPLRLDSNRKILDNVALIGFYGLPLDYLDQYRENIEKVTVASIREAFARHLRPETLVTVIVGAGAVEK